MHPIKQLQKLLNPKSNNNGRVIATNQDSLTIATAQGSRVISKSSGDATQYRVGDSVALVNGQVVGKRSNAPTVYVI